MKVKSLSRVRLCATPWTAAYQAPLSMGFSRQEHWSGVPLPSLEKKKKKHMLVFFKRENVVSQRDVPALNSSRILWVGRGSPYVIRQKGLENEGG